MKSTIEKKADLEEGKVITVEINWNDPNWELRKNQLVAALPDTTTKKEIGERIQTMIMRESCFNKAMDHLSKAFSFKLSESELKDQIALIDQQLRPQFEEAKKYNPDLKEQVLIDNETAIAKTAIMRELIFQEIQKLKNVTITDDDVKEHLKEYNKQTGRSIEEFNDTSSKEFLTIKRMVLDNKIIDAVLSMYKFEPPASQKEGNKNK